VEVELVDMYYALTFIDIIYIFLVLDICAIWRKSLPILYELSFCCTVRHRFL